MSAIEEGLRDERDADHDETFCPWADVNESTKTLNKIPATFDCWSNKEKRMNTKKYYFQIAALWHKREAGVIPTEVVENTKELVPIMVVLASSEDEAKLILSAKIGAAAQGSPALAPALDDLNQVQLYAKRF